jgi:uncharacterized protein YdaU (DUF1376 family)
LNYYERHIGDYLKDTSHLSLLEHGIYGRLLDVYYTREGAIPDVQAARLIGARSKDERDALSAVLSEFFELVDAHWHQGRCDAEIDAYRGKQAEKGDTKEAAKERQRRARERRAQLFEALRSLGVTMPFKATTAELEAELSRATSHRTSRSVTRDESQGVTRDDTATQTPDTRPSNQTPDPNTHTPSAATDAVCVPGDPPMPPKAEPTRAGQLCRLMRQAGIADTNPGHPDLIALADAGVTDAEAKGAACTAVDRGKGFAYAIGTLKRQRIEAAKTAQQVLKGAMPVKPPTQAELNSLAHGFAIGVYGPATFDPIPTTQPETVDVESRLIAP